jgi:DNA-directed RNA polymerase specialized sigma24 family protein
MVGLVQTALHGASPTEKEAFILHVMEGFSIDEISTITTRTREEIEGAIAVARHRLRQAAPLTNFKGKLLQQTGTA